MSLIAGTCLSATARTTNAETAAPAENTTKPEMDLQIALTCTNAADRTGFESPDSLPRDITVNPRLRRRLAQPRRQRTADHRHLRRLLRGICHRQETGR